MPLRPARKGAGDIEIPLGSSAKDICYLARGEYFACHTPGSKACMIHKKADAPWHVDRIEFNPFGFDLGSNEAIGPYKLLMASVSGKVTAEVENTTKDGEHDLATISIHGVNPKEARFGLLTSSEWNYLPREYFYKASPTGERQFVFKTLEATRAPNGCWFPIKVLRIFPIGRVGRNKAVLVVVKSIKFKVADTDLEGVFEVDAGAQFNVIGKPHFFTSRHKETVSLSNLESFYQRAVTNGLRYKAIEQKAKAP